MKFSKKDLQNTEKKKANTEGSNIKKKIFSRRRFTMMIKDRRKFCKETNTKSWKNFLIWLKNSVLPINSRFDYYSKENRIYLIVDTYGVHKCNEIIDFATNLN